MKVTDDHGMQSCLSLRSLEALETSRLDVPEDVADRRQRYKDRHLDRLRRGLAVIALPPSWNRTLPLDSRDRSFTLTMSSTELTDDAVSRPHITASNRSSKFNPGE
jgi:hypothetical protein